MKDLAEASETKALVLAEQIETYDDMLVEAKGKLDEHREVQKMYEQQSQMKVVKLKEKHREAHDEHYKAKQIRNRKKKTNQEQDKRNEEVKKTQEELAE